MGEFFTSDEQGIEGVCAVGTVFEEIFLRLGQLLAPFILMETVASACHTGSLNSEKESLNNLIRLEGIYKSTTFADVITNSGE